MQSKLPVQPDSLQPMVYQIRLKGHLDSQWTDWFDALAITLEEDGNTLLSGPVTDQAALHGLLKKIRDLGMPLVSITQVQLDAPSSLPFKKGEKMNLQNKSISEIPAKLSTLWILVMF